MTARNTPVTYVRSRFPTAAPAERTAAAWRRLVQDEALRESLDLPGRLLSGYFRERQRSPLGQIVAPANTAAAECETLLVVGPAEAVADARRLVAACAHPLHNLLPAGGRAGRARVVLLEASWDNDLLHAALDLVRRACDGPAFHNRWALAIVGPADDTDEEQARAVRECAAPLADALVDVSATDDDLLERLFIQAATPAAGTLLVADRFRYTPMPRLSEALPVSGPALLAATAIGVDTVSLLKGSVWFWEAAKKPAATESPIVQLAEFARRPGFAVAAWHHALLPVAEVLAASRPGRCEVVAAYRYEGRARLRELPTNAVLHLAADIPRRDRFTIDVAEPLVDHYDKLSVEAEIRLTRLHDIGIGELYQWFAAAATLEKLSSV
ncbi:MAG: hypothetical protein J0M17_20400 [Planctomycetes bacterium]|nr:hypothetical protein [Planctomycetota bacterium]